MCMCIRGFCNVWICVCVVVCVGFLNVCVCECFVMFVCVCVGFLMGGSVYVCVF